MNIFQFIFLILISCTSLAQNCQSIEASQLSNDLQMRQSQLQDAMDDCPSLINAIYLAQVFQQLGRSRIADEVMLDALNDSVATDDDRAKWLIASIDLAVKSKNTCKASQYLNELNYLSGYQKDYLKYRKKLYASTQNQILDSQTIGCALAENRSVSFRGMKIKPKIDLAIHFDFNSDKLTEKGRQQTQQLANALNNVSLKDKQLTLTGHTDSVGAADYNLDLSQRRSQSVKYYLLSIDPVFSARISTNGMGEMQLLSQEISDKNHQLNRRVEIQLQ